MLHRGNLTARERFLLLIKNDVHKMKTGKEILTPADKDALENWHSNNSTEAREWNRLNDGWKYSGRMEIEAELIYKDAKIAYLSQLPIIMKLLSYPGHREMAGCINTLKQIKKVTVEEATEIATKQRAVKIREGVDLEHAVYNLAFQMLSSEDKEKMNELYPDIETDHQYLDQEEILANLYNGKSELSDTAKERLAELVAEKSYNKFAKEYQLFHYFACIPLVEVAKYFLRSKGIKINGKPLSKNQECDDEDSVTCNDVTASVVSYAAEHKISVEEMLKEGLRIGIEAGILNDYRPLSVSNSSELLDRWLSTKVEARNILQGHVISGELVLRERTEEETRKDMLYSKGLYNGELETARKVLENIGIEITEKGEIEEKVAFEPFEGSVISGESLCAFTEDYDFVIKFKEQVDRYDPNLGLVYDENDPDHKSEHLDQELLVCSMNDEGEADIFSMFGMTVSKISALTRGNAFFEEIVEDSKEVLKFKDAALGVAFMARRDDLINSYSQLLAFKSVLDKISKIYDVDMAEHVTERLKIIKEHIEQNNEAIQVAINTHEKSKKSKSEIMFSRKELRFQHDLIIDLDAIEQNEKTVTEHTTKFKEIFGAEF